MTVKSLLSQRIPEREREKSKDEEKREGRREKKGQHGSSIYLLVRRSREIIG